jgi:KaiC domain protein
MTDDDWFERALTEDEADDGEAPADRPDDSDGTQGNEDGSDGDAPFADDFASELEGDGTGDDGTGSDDGGPFGGAEANGDGGDDGVFGGGEDGGGRNDLFGGGGSGAFDGGDGGAFGGTEGSAFGGGDEFGMGEFGSSDDTADFSDEAVESEMDRIDLGIEGLDEMIRGGVPDSSLMAIIGSAGTGKTTFGLQFLEQGLAEGERCIYITLEESEDRIVTSAEEKGWPYREYVEEGRLVVVDMDPIEMANSLSSIRSELPRLIDRFGARRLVLDSVSLLEMMYEDRATRRNEIYTFARSLKESGVTTLLTSEADEDNPYASRHGIVEYLTDAVYILQYVRPSHFQEARLAVEIQKIRDAHHSRDINPYHITDEGLSVYQQADIF